MNQTSKFTCALLSLLIANVAMAKELALSFDDAPRAGTQILSGDERTTMLIQKLKEAQVGEVVFFCNTVRFDQNGLDRINRYIGAGHLIANHTHSHPELNKITPEEFWADADRADKILSGMKNFRRWLRFPFLREGKTVADRDFVRAAMKSINYINGYVTIDSADWYMDSLVQKKKNAGFDVDLEKLKHAYVDMLIDTVEFYDELAVKTLNRSPKHVLLLHENDLAALFIGDLVAALKKKDWNIISADVAYQDPISKIEPDTLISNQGQIAAIARANGFTGSIWSKWEEENDIDQHFDNLGIFTKHHSPPQRR